MDAKAFWAQLQELQDLDRRLARLAQRHFVLSQSRDHGRNLQAVAQQRRRQQLSDMRSAQELLSDLAWELEDIEVRLRDLHSQQPGSGDVLLDREVKSLEQRKAQLEQRVLELMLQTEDLNRQIPDERAELARSTDRHLQQDQRLNRLIGRLEQQIQDQNRRRRQIAALLPPALFQMYDELRPATANQPLAMLTDGHCSSCGAAVAQPVATAFEGLATCPTCGRLLLF